MSSDNEMYGNSNMYDEYDDDMNNEYNSDNDEKIDPYYIQSTKKVVPNTFIKTNKSLDKILSIPNIGVPYVPNIVMPQIGIQQNEVPYIPNMKVQQNVPKLKLKIINEKEDKEEKLYKKAISCIQADVVDLVLYFLDDNFKTIDIECKQIFFWDDNSKLWQEGNKTVIISYICYNISPKIKDKAISLFTQLKNFSDKESEKFKQLENYQKTLFKLTGHLGSKNYTSGLVDILLPLIRDLSFSKKLDSIINILAIKGKKIINFENREVRDRIKNDYCTHEINIDYNPNAKNNIFDNFLDDIMLKDKSLIDRLQLIIGSCITGSISLRRLFIFHGPGASNGKSTLMDMLSNILGNKYYKQIDKKVILNSKFEANSSTHSSHLADLVGARVAVASEFTSKDIINTTLMKTLTGGDLISYRQINAKQSSFMPQLTPIILTEKKPIIDVGQGEIDRLELFPFLCRFVDVITDPETERQKDPNFKANVIKNKEVMSAFFTWAVEGAFILFSDPKNYPPIPEKVKIRNSEYILEQDIYRRFIDEKLEIPVQQFEGEKGGGIKGIPNNLRYKSSDLYKDFKFWCIEELIMKNYDIPNITDFGIKMSTLLDYRFLSKTKYYICKTKPIDNENETDYGVSTKNSLVLVDIIKTQ